MDKVIAKPRQKKAAKAVIDNLMNDNPKPLDKVLKSVGYGTGLQHNPNRVLESQGFKQAIRDLGLTEELITSSLVEDIKSKPQNRLGELRLGAEVLGMKQDEDKPPAKTGNTYNLFFSKDIQESVKELEERIKLKLTQKDVKEN